MACGKRGEITAVDRTTVWGLSTAMRERNVFGKIRGSVTLAQSVIEKMENKKALARRAIRCHGIADPPCLKKRVFRGTLLLALLCKGLRGLYTS